MLGCQAIALPSTEQIVPQFWKVRSIPFWEGRILQNSPQQLRVSSTFIHPPELIWDSPYARGLRYHLPFRGPLRLITYNFHRHVQYYITFHYHSCSIDKYRHVEGPKCHNFGRLGISHFEKEGFCKTHPKSWESFLHIYSPTWADLRFPLCQGSEISSTFSDDISDWHIITSMHMYSITITTIAVVLTNTDMWKVQNATILKGYEYTHFEKAGYLSSGQLRLTTCQAELM